MLPRRSLLLGVGVLPLAACSTISAGGDGWSDIVDEALAPIDGCRSPEALASFDTLGGAPLTYEISGTPQPFRSDPDLFASLEAWATDWVALSGLGPLTAVSTYGAYVDKCSSWHAAGRAFDFGVLTHANGEVSCRYDVWGDDPTRLRDYWRLAASLAKHFTHTLTYRYNAQHHNHIHIDDGLSRDTSPRLRERSAAQVEVIQGVLRHVFGRDVPDHGRFDGPTRDAARSVQRDLGLTNRLATPEGWAGFLDAAARG